MHALLQVTLSAPRNLAVAALAFTVAYVPTPTPTPGPGPTSTPLPILTPTRTPTPGLTLIPTSTPTIGAPTSTPTSGGPTATPTPGPSATPIGPALTWTPTRTPTRPVPSSTPTRTPSATPIITSTPRAIPVSIHSIHMMDATTGWAEGYVGTGDETRILRTTDGGATWRDVGPALPDRFGTQAFFMDAQSAWVWNSTEGDAWRTQDGGVSWVQVSHIGWSPDIWFNDSQHGWKLEATVWGLSFIHFDIESFATTQDGGQTWEERNPPPSWGYAYMAYPNAQTAWAIRAGYAKTWGGTFLSAPFRVESTSNGGRTWVSRTMPLPPGAEVAHDFEQGPYLNEGECDLLSPAYSSIAIWKLAVSCDGRGWMYTTANQGKTWIISALPVGGKAVELQFLNPRFGWLLTRDQLDNSQSHLYQTTNGGQSWTLLKRTGWTGAQFDFLDAQIGWAVASSCPELRCYWYEYVTAVVKTIDGGRTWQLVEPRLAQ